jgi:hypothetical protein
LARIAGVASYTFGRNHHFSDYMLFSVDENQKIAAPPMNVESDASPSLGQTSNGTNGDFRTTSTPSPKRSILLAD